MAGIQLAGAGLGTFNDILLRGVDIESQGVGIARKTTCRACLDIQEGLIPPPVVIDVCCRVFCAGGAVAKTPQQSVFRSVDFGREGHGLVDAIGKIVVRHHLHVVKGQAGAQVNGV